MAAAFGHAARRLGGGALRQTQEGAVSRLSSRFAHTEAQPGCSCGKFEKDALFKGIQKKKEELYEAVAEAHRKYGKDKDNVCRTNRRMLRELSNQVCRRSSGDRTWEWARKSQARHDVIKATGYVTLFFGVPYYSLKALASVIPEIPEDLDLDE